MANRRPTRPFSNRNLAFGVILSFCFFGLDAQTNAPNRPNTPEIGDNTRITPSAPNSQAWHLLNPQQKQALAPLGAQWGSLTAQQKSKWLTISENFTQLSVADQITMHTRMADWVSLSPQQRNLARLNFNKLQNLPKEDKKAKWDAYQALSSEEKRLLSAESSVPTKSAAPTAKPVEPHRQVKTAVKTAPENQKPSSEINRKTLLPHPPAIAAPSSPSVPLAPQQQPLTPEGNRQSPESTPS